MISNLQTYISITFGITTFVTLLLFIRTIKSSTLKNASNKSTIVLIGLIGWLIFQASMSLNNVYNLDTNSFPPKIMLFGIFPCILTISILFITRKGKEFIDSLSLKNLTYLNIVRIPVEIVLYWLFLEKAVPKLMTFEGRNFDILAGISAPIIAYYGIVKQKIGRKGILVWNFICLALLLNIVIYAILSTPSPIQKFAFNQPNIGILNFPFSWLPTFIAPLILFCHLTSIRQLLTRNKN